VRAATGDLQSQLKDSGSHVQYNYVVALPMTHELRLASHVSIKALCLPAHEAHGSPAGVSQQLLDPHTQKCTRDDR
jgi:hypothetical protein